MRKILIVVSGLLFIGMVAGLVAYSRLPGSVSRVNSLLNYAQSGTFNYSIQMKPSTLYGNPQQEYSTYPVAIVDNVGFTYTYHKPAQTGGTLTICEILSNPGVWQKTVNIISPTQITGDFSLEFPLSVPETIQTFKDIEKTVAITGMPPRQVTLNVSVKSGDSIFTQDLSIDLTESTMKVSNDLIKQDINGSGTFDYVVNLTDPGLLGTAVLKPAVSVQDSLSEIGVGVPVLAKLCDYMDVSFTYRFKPSKPVTNLNTTAEISAIVTAPNLWSRTFPLVSKTSQQGIIELDFPINLADYIQLINSVVAESSAVTDTYNIILQVNIHTVAESQYGHIDEFFNPSLNGIIKSNVLNWDKQVSTSRSGAIEGKELVSNTGKVVGLTVFGILAFLVAAGFIFLMFLYTRVKPSRVPLSEKEADTIRKKYGSRIANASGRIVESASQVVIMDTMLDLVKIADEIGKPIIQQQAASVTYCVLDGQICYQYSPYSRHETLGEAIDEQSRSN